MNLKENLHIAIQAAVEAGKEIMKVYGTKFTVEDKEDKSPLTEADKQSHEVIMKWLKDTGIHVLSEEGKHLPYDKRAGWDMLWIVDPLDGTKEFIKRNGEFTVNIALVDKQVAVLGVIYIPVTKELYFSLQGTGAFKLNLSKAINIYPSMDIQKLLDHSARIPFRNVRRSFTVVCSRSHLSIETESYIETLKKDHHEIDYASKGSSLKFCLIAEGMADIYPRFAPTMEWDTAAGQAIVEASGGNVSLHDGTGSLLYNKEDLLNPWFIVSR